MHKKVLTSDGYSSTFDKTKIIEEVRKNCAAMGVDVTEKQLNTIATNTEESIKEMKPKHLTGSLIRSVSLIEMLDLGLEDVYKACAKVGMPVADMMSIWQVEGDSVHDNANLDGMNQETQHKHIADKMCKEAVLTMLPSEIAKGHIEGAFHCHDMEYFVNRQFCLPADETVLIRDKLGTHILPIGEIADATHIELLTPMGWMKVKLVTSRPSPSKLIEIETADGRMVKTTPEHRILLKNGKRKMASEIQIGDELLPIAHHGCNGSIHLDDVDARFIGLFIAEGHYNGNSRNGYRVVITGNDELTKEIVYNYANKYGYHVTESLIEGKSPQYIISKKEVYDMLLLEHGIMHGALNKCLPYNFWLFDNHTQAVMIGAMFKGDGSVQYVKAESCLKVYYSTSSKLLAKQLSLWLHYNGISNRIRTNTRKTQYHTNGPQYKVRFTTSTLLKHMDSIEFIGIQHTNMEDFLCNVKRMSKKPRNLNCVSKITHIPASSELVHDVVLDAPEDELIKHQFIAGSGIYVSNCFDSDLRFILYYGLWPDGVGRTLPVARAAQTAEVAFLHAAKALGSSQCNCAGGQGYNSFNVLIAPYLYMKSYDEIKQLAQLFIYEMGQMIVARGAQPCFSSIQLYPGVPAVWWDRPVVYKGQIWDGEPRTSKPSTQEDHVWCYSGKTGDGRLFFNRRIIETPVVAEPKVVPRKTYGQFDREARLLFRAFMEIYTTGDIRGRPFTFPKAEVVFSKEFMDSPKFDQPVTWRNGEWFAPSYKELYQAAIKLALVNGTPYFESQYHEENPLTTVSCVQCCAYSFALSEEETTGFNDMMDFTNGAHIDSLGSMQVVSLNLPRASYVALEGEEEDKFMAALKYLRQQIDCAVRVFGIKRDFMKKQASPFMRQQVVDPNDPMKKSPVFCNLDKLTYVIGMVGLNEFVQALTGKQLHESDDAVIMGQRLVGSLNLYCGKVGHENDMVIALARTPAETTAQRFAVQDLIRYPKYAKKYVKGNIKEAIKALPYKRDVPIQYSNGTHLAVDAPVTLEKKIEIEGSFFEILKGGNIFHVFLDDIAPMMRASEIGTGEIHQSYVDDTMEYIFKIFRTTPINYLAITKDSTICNSCNAITPGVNEKCPKCESTDVDFFSRITGYLEPISQWNAAKKQEFMDRHRYGEVDVRG